MKKVTKLGSYCNNSSNAGTFYWNLNNATSNRNWNISRQLVNARFSRGIFPGCFNIKICIPERPCHMAKQTAPERGKLKIKFGRVGRL